MKHSSPRNFCGLPREFSGYESAAFAVLPVPFDGTSTWGKGADRGPDALIDASCHMELFDIESQSEPYRAGIHTLPPVRADSDRRMVERVYQKVASLLEDGKFVITLGGEHSISSAPIRAHAEKFKKMSVLQLDAHTDMRESFEGSKYNHASVMARVKEYVKTITSVGIRSMDASEIPNVKKTSVFYAHEVHRSSKWISEVVASLTDEVYLTIDLDVFDPGVLPGTGTPEPGGLSWVQVMDLLVAVAAKKRIVGFDVVELAPIKGQPASDFLAAKLVYRLIALVNAQRSTKSKRSR